MSAPRPVRSVYVHAPFCSRRCVYCDFAVQVEARPDPTFWLEAIGAEWALIAEGGDYPVPELHTLYVGGGTPTLLGADAMVHLSRRIPIAWGQDAEWTSEANPESLLPGLARAWRGAGVNRLSIGVQSFHEPALRWMGRLHGPEGARRAVATARAAGFDNISLDLIFALPAHLGRNWREDLEQALRLSPEHVSLYGLGIEPGSALGRAVRENREPVVDDARYAAEFLEAAEVLTNEGYEHYEVSNFARPGRRSRHNATYWTGEPYLGLGNGAHSFQDPIRRWNLRDWKEYRDRVLGGALATAGQEALTETQMRLERIWLGLRTSEGLLLEELDEPQRNAVRTWVDRGWAEVAAPRARLTREGWLHLDRLSVELDSSRAAGPGAESSLSRCEPLDSSDA